MSTQSTAPDVPRVFVIWTRYERPDGRIVRHVYGTYPTRAKAQTVVRHMIKLQEELHGPESMQRAEVAVVPLIIER